LSISIRRAGVAARLVAGVLLGGTVGAMHYLGMAALILPGIIIYDPILVGASLVVGAGFAAIGALSSGRVHPAVSALILVLAVCGLHFTAMAAVTILKIGGLILAAPQIAPALLAVAVAAVCLVILLPGLGGAIIDQHLAGRTERESARLRQFALSTFEGILFHRDGVVTDTNAALCGMLGLCRQRDYRPAAVHAVPAEILRAAAARGRFVHRRRSRAARPRRRRAPGRVVRPKCQRGGAGHQRAGRS